MMRASPWLRGLTVLSWVGAGGCSTMREIPRADYAAAEERKHVSVETGDGVHRVFDFARIGSDTLTGYRQRETEGGFEDYETVAIPLDAVERLSARRIDWYRTLLVGGAGLAAILAAALSAGKAADPEIPPPPPPCEPCTP